MLGAEVGQLGVGCLTPTTQSALLLSVIVPAYNEESTIGLVLRTLLDLPYPALDVVVVDDGSTDRTGFVADAVAHSDSRVRVIRHERNRGKGAAIKTALHHTLGDVIVIQDADLENDPRDLLRILALFGNPSVSVVYGSR